MLTPTQTMSFTLHGDVKFKFSHQGFFVSDMFRVMFNTAFIKDNVLIASKMELSPEDIRKSKDVPNDFSLQIHFEDFCDVCNPYETEIDDLCEKCVKELGPATIREWKVCEEILKGHLFPSMKDGQELLPGEDPAVVADLISRQLQFNADYYRINGQRQKL